MAAPSWLTEPTPTAASETPTDSPPLYAEWAALLEPQKIEDAIAGQPDDAVTPDMLAQLQKSLQEKQGQGSADFAYTTETAAPTPDEADYLVSAAEPPGEPALPTVDQTPVNLGAVDQLVADGKLDEAGELYRAVLRVDYAKAPEYLPIIKDLVDKFPNNGPIRLALGDAYMRSGRFQKAIEEYNRAAEYSRARQEQAAAAA